MSLALYLRLTRVCEEAPAPDAGVTGADGAGGGGNHVATDEDITPDLEAAFDEDEDEGGGDDQGRKPGGDDEPPPKPAAEPPAPKPRADVPPVVKPTEQPKPAVQPKPGEPPPAPQPGAALAAAEAAATKRKADATAAAARQQTEQQEREAAEKAAKEQPPFSPKAYLDWLVSQAGDKYRVTDPTAEPDEKGEVATMPYKDYVAQYRPLLEAEAVKDHIFQQRVIAPLHQAIEMLELRLEAERAYRTLAGKFGHADIYDLVDSDELKAWAATASEGIRELLDSSDPADINLALCAFKEAKGLPVPSARQPAAAPSAVEAARQRQQQENDRQRALHRPPPGGRHARPPTPGSETFTKDDEEAAFNEDDDDTSKRRTKPLQVR